MSDVKQNSDDFIKGYALGKAEHTSVNGALRNLCNLVNEHTMLLMALCKKFNTTPEELFGLLTQDEFINDADMKNVDGNEDRTKLVS